MSAFQLDDAAMEDRFQVFGRMEILSVLQDLLLRREPLSVLYREGTESLLTRLLSVRADGLVFDRCTDEASNQRLQASERVVFSARPDGVRVQFICPRPQRVEWDADDALWVPLPTRVSRLQRRDFFRVPCPLAKPFRAAFDIPRGRLELPVHDLSLGGLGLTLQVEYLELPVDLALPDVMLYLPDEEPLRLGAVVRHLTPVPPIAGRPARRLGLAFTALDRHCEALLQRWVIRIEHDRHKLAKN